MYNKYIIKIEHDGGIEYCAVSANGLQSLAKMLDENWGEDYDKIEIELASYDTDPFIWFKERNMKDIREENEV